MYKGRRLVVGFLKSCYHPTTISLPRQRLKGIEAYVVVLESIIGKLRDSHIAEGLRQTENRLASTIPMWHLDCLPDEEAARRCHDTICSTF